MVELTGTKFYSVNFGEDDEATVVVNGQVLKQNKSLEMWCYPDHSVFTHNVSVIYNNNRNKATVSSLGGEMGYIIVIDEYGMAWCTYGIGIIHRKDMVK